jgi:hypothetical protein
LTEQPPGPQLGSPSAVTRRRRSLLRYAFPIGEATLYVVAIFGFVFGVIERLIPEPALLYRIQTHNVPNLMMEIVELENTSNTPLFPLKAIWTIDSPNPSILLRAERTAPTSDIAVTTRTRTITLTRALSAYEQMKVYVFAPGPFVAKGPVFEVFISTSIGDRISKTPINAIKQETWDAQRMQLLKKLLGLAAGLLGFGLLVRETSRWLTRKFT